MRTIVTLLMIITMMGTPSAQPAQGEAPFGLTWGMSALQPQAQGISLSDSPDQTYGKSYSATNLPKVITDAELVFLAFGHDDKLWRIAVASTSIKNDPYGSSIKRRYDELANALGEKYGKGKQEHFAARGYDTEHFVMGIKGGNNWWYTNFANSVVTVQIGIGAADYTTPYWRLIYTNKALSAAFEKTKREREKNAL